MTDIDVTIGWNTARDAEGRNLGWARGWMPGDTMHTEELTLEAPGTARPAIDFLEVVCEAAFDATNNPAPTESLTPFGRQIREALAARGFDGSQSGHYSLSVGDTVTVAEVMFECRAFGWKRVEAMA